MIHTATQTGKFIKFVRCLRQYFSGTEIDAETIAVGILERLWHLTINSARRGDIGRIDNETIAEAVGWLRPADELIEILVKTGWLDKSEAHRLVVHDWNKHAPGFVKKNIGRQGGFVVSSEDISEPKPSSPEERRIDELAQVNTNARTPNTTEHNPTKPAREKAALSAVNSANNKSSQLTEYTFPISGKESTTWTLPQSKYTEYMQSYPALDVPEQLRKARQWCRDNPEKRKTAKGMFRFLTGWLNRAQNKISTPNLARTRQNRSHDDPRGNLAVREELLAELGDEQKKD